MKERPILFSGPMVRALLDGSKTQTRRVMNPPPSMVDRSGCWYGRNPASLQNRPSKYGVQGDRLWVRETFRHDDYSQDDPARTIYRADHPEIAQQTKGIIKWRPAIFMPRNRSRILLEISDVRVQRLRDITSGDVLEEGVRIPCDADGTVLIDISSKHAPARYLPAGYLKPGMVHDPEHNQLLWAHFASLWDSINHGRAPWGSNPFVWALTFKRVMSS